MCSLTFSSDRLENVMHCIVKEMIVQYEMLPNKNCVSGEIHLYLSKLRYIFPLVNRLLIMYIFVKCDKKYPMSRKVCSL